MRACMHYHVPVLNVGAALQQLLHNVHVTFFSCADQRRPAILLLPWKQLLVACSRATTVAVEGLEAVCVRACVCADHVVQVDVGPSPDELLHDVQAALLGRQHEGRLSILSYPHTHTYTYKQIS